MKFPTPDVLPTVFPGGGCIGQSREKENITLGFPFDLKLFNDLIYNMFGMLSKFDFKITALNPSKPDSVKVYLSTNVDAHDTYIGFNLYE